MGSGWEADSIKTEKFSVTGMTCAACQANVTRRVLKLPGVSSADVSLLANRMTVSYDEALSDPSAICAAVSSIGYGASPEAPAAEKRGGFRSGWQARQAEAEGEMRAMGRRLAASALLLLPLMYVAMGHMLSLPMPGLLTGAENALIAAFTQLLITLPILYLNRAFFQRGFKALGHAAPNMDSLVALGSAAALIYGLFVLYLMMYAAGRGDIQALGRYSHQLYFESSAMILTLVTVGKYLESRSKSRTSDALGRLVDLSPRTASVIRGGQETVIPAEELRVGDLVIIRPGGSIPADGVVTEGRGYVDQAAITGESLPVEKGPGDTVITATINKNGSFRMECSKVGDDTTLAQIIRVVDQAGTSKAPIARLADRVSGVFVPAVICAALLTAGIWGAAGAGLEFALSCAISVLVISCPCALGLATPVAIMAGTGRAAELGILIRSAQALEGLHSINAVVLDKTGTLTTGSPSVTDVFPTDPELSGDRLVAFAAAVEQGSEHPLAAAVAERAAALGLQLPAVSDFEAHAGLGVSAVAEGQPWLGGSAAFMALQGVDTSAAGEAAAAFAAAGKTPLYFARAGRTVGVIAVADTPREDSAAAVARMRALGLRVIMLTGDNAVTAGAMASGMGIDEIVSDVLPTEKEAHIRALQEKGLRVAMVGDGINDAPALTRADIGIAMGAGTDIALDSADVVLMRSSLTDVCRAYELSRAVMRNIRENLFWAFFYNVLGIPVAAGALYPSLGLQLSPMLGAAAMSLSSVCVVSNALRLRFWRGKNHKPSEKAPEGQEGSDTVQKILTVEGMMCAHCKASVEKALSAVPGVESAAVDLEAKTASVTLSAPVEDAALTRAVTDAGYQVLKVV